MAANKINVLKTRDYTWKFKGKFSEDTATAVLKYKDDFDGWATRCPYYGEVHPDLPSFNLVEIDADKEAGEVIAVTLTYESYSFSAEIPGKPGSEEPTPRYSVRIAGREEHILTNPFADGLDDTELKALLAISNGTEDKDGGGSYAADVTTTEGLAILAKIRKGNVATKTGGLVYLERKVTDSLADINFTKLYKTGAPPGPVGGAATSWLYIGADADQSTDGLFYNLERQWEYSPDGWDADLYPPA